MSGAREFNANPAVAAPGASGVSRARAGLAVLGWLIVYVGLEWASFIHEYRGLPITPWNPGLGVLFALLIVRSSWYGAVLFVGVIAAEVLVVDSALGWFEIVVVAGVLAAGYTGAALVARKLELDVGLDKLRDILVLLGAGFGGAVVVALVLSVFFLATDRIDPPDLVPASLPLLIGDVIGICVVTPLMLRARSLARVAAAWRGSLGALIETVVILAALLALLAAAIAAERMGGFNYFYLVFVPVVVAAVRHGLDGACLGLAVAQLGLVGLLHGHGFNVDVFIEYQTLMLVLSATGLVVGVVVEERARAERVARQAEDRLKAMETEALQAARANLVTGMASALAHEINQPMTAARALARSAQHLLAQPAADTARVSANLGDLVSQIDHAGNIVKRMRGFLGRDGLRASTLELRAVLNDAAMLARAAAKAYNVTVSVDVAPDLPAVHGDHIQLQQVVLNLINNGVDSIRATGRGGGEIRIQAHAVPDARRIEVTVADNGAGMSPDVRKRLFQPLVTSKPEGLGLGLSICASIVESHGGRIWLAKGDPGATEFRFELPVSRKVK